MKKQLISLWVVLSAAIVIFAENTEEITIAAAADLKYAMDEIVIKFKKVNPHSIVKVVYGSSGKTNTQILQGAPYDIFFCADIKYPLELLKKGFGASNVKTYAWGRIVLWSSTLDTFNLSISNLTNPLIKRIAVANPAHAPYGERACEFLKSLDLWEELKKKLVYGENIAQAAQFVATGNADIGILALSIVQNPGMMKKGHYVLIPDSLHTPLEQGYIILKRAADNKLAKSFADFMDGNLSRTTMKKYGFLLPNDK